MPRTTALRALLALVLTGAAVLAPAAAASATTGAAPTRAATTAVSKTHSLTRGLDYVALGDSYAAGYGLGDLTKQPVTGCSQSGLDYPHRVAEELGLDLTDVSCAGATTADVTDTKQLGAPPQVSALSRSTKLVTVSIGGNDAGLFGAASSCIALSKSGPIFGAAGAATSCRARYVKDGHDTLTSDIETTTAKGLASAFATIRRHAPQAKVIVVGYPAVFPDRANTPANGCYRPVIDGQVLSDGFPKDGFPFTSTDVAYLSGVQATLDRVTKQAADHAGFRYVSTLAASEAHSGCATSGSYIEGISLTATEYFKSISLQKGALHPNDRGVAFLARATSTAVKAALQPTATEAPRPVATRSPGAIWFGVGGAVLIALALVVIVARRRRSRA